MKQVSAYLIVAVLAIGTAFALSLKFAGALRAQEPPAAEAGAEEIPPAGTEMPAAETVAPPADTPAPPPANPPAGAPAPGQAQAPPIPGATQSSNSGIAELEGFLEPFIYDVANRRDPFLAYAEFISPEEGPLRALTPAQRFALEELRLVGVMWEVKDPKAMFMDPDDEVLVLGRDESIGNRNGYIAAIREGEVVVVEAIRKRGDIIYRTRVLRIER